MLEWEWWDDHNATRLLIFLLCRVNYETKKWKGIEVKAGSLITSFPKLAQETGMTVKSVRVAMDKLEGAREVARTRAREGQLVTLVKWEKLQHKENEGAQGRADDKADEGQTKGRRRATTKEGNKGKKGNKDKKEELTIWPTFDDFWDAYDKKVDRNNVEAKWDKLNQNTKEAIIRHVEQYVTATPDKKYRKNPKTYLNARSWEDEEIINQNLKGNGQIDFNKLDPKQLAEYIKQRGF